MEGVILGRASVGVWAPAASGCALLLRRGGLVGLFGFLFLPTPFSLRPVPPSQHSPSHRTGARPRPSSAPASPAAASSNEHLPCFQWAGAAVAAAARAGCGCCRLRIMMTGECVCVPGPDELVGIHLKTCVGYSGRMVTDSLCGWF